jgi:hypothetical protein
MTRAFAFFFILFSNSILNARAQASNYNLPKLAVQNKIKVINRERSIATNDNVSSVHLSSKDNDGVSWNDGFEFSNGIIEIDLKGKDILQQNFIGIAFHGVDEKTLDAVYFCPFNFQSTDSIGKTHAEQYVSHPYFPWQIWREKYSVIYEQPILTSSDPNTWFHLKIVVIYPQIRVFVNNNTASCLTGQHLNKRTTGMLGLWVGNSSEKDFANLTITKQ